VKRLIVVWRGFVHWLAWLNGDAAYRACCRRAAREHSEGCGHRPPTRAEFFRAEQERRWSGIRRCC
jgi:hypothetical protein